MKFNLLEIMQRIDFCLHNRISLTMLFLLPHGAIKWYLRISKPMGTIFAESARSNPFPKYVKHSRQEVRCPQAKNTPQGAFVCEHFEECFTKWAWRTIEFVMELVIRSTFCFRFLCLVEGKSTEPAFLKILMFFVFETI
jgi:hypothetical protein